MPTFTMREAAELLGVSDDTVRRWADAGRFAVVERDGGRRASTAPSWPASPSELAAEERPPAPPRESARNRFVGIVTGSCATPSWRRSRSSAGPYRIVSLMSREAADELGLEPGVARLASVKATNVVVELPTDRR